MSKLRSKYKQQSRKVELLEKRIHDLVGMNDELERMLVEYETEEACFRVTPKHLQLDEII
tara:strand:+ start:217 stop:396 length:180 start_codon:yes stop_codon:yes gene_type:complete